MLTEIRIAGFGGQGVILAAAVIGKARAIFEAGFATMTQSFGPEARGGSSSAQVILSTEPILYPYITRPDVLIVMSQEAGTRFIPELRPGGILIAEQELVRVGNLPAGTRAFGVPATRLAEELGRKMVLNIVMVGFFGAVTRGFFGAGVNRAVRGGTNARGVAVCASTSTFSPGLIMAKPGARRAGSICIRRSPSTVALACGGS